MTDRPKIDAAMSEATSTTACSSCGYTEADARLHGDHHLCPNDGKAPWQRKSAAGAASTEMAEQVAANHGFYICTCGFLGKEVEVTSKAYVVVAITEATAKLQAEVATLKARRESEVSALHKLLGMSPIDSRTRNKRAETAERALAAERAQNEGLREALNNAPIGTIRWADGGAISLQEFIKALLSTPVAPAQQLADLSEPQRTALFGIPSEDDPFAKAVAPAQKEE